jgi:hypothetical protein
MGEIMALHDHWLVDGGDERWNKGYCGWEKDRSMEQVLRAE